MKCLCYSKFESGNVLNNKYLLPIQFTEYKFFPFYISMVFFPDSTKAHDFRKYYVIMFLEKIILLDLEESILE